MANIHAIFGLQAVQIDQVRVSEVKEVQEIILVFHRKTDLRTVARFWLSKSKLNQTETSKPFANRFALSSSQVLLDTSVRVTPIQCKPFL